MRLKAIKLQPAKLHRLVFPLVVGLRRAELAAEPVDGVSGAEASAEGPQFGIVTEAADGHVLLYPAGSREAQRLSFAEFCERSDGRAWLCAPVAEAATDPDAVGSVNKRFGFKWFVPELLKHRRVWRDVLFASAALQIIALATPLFTQAIIDKVVVHHTQSTLIAIGIAMALFTVFGSILTWVRQYLVLHTGNRVDAVLGAAVWEHLLCLPLRYFEHRPTGVVAARMHGVENIRQFVAGAAVSLVLDLPFLLICLGVMFWYSVTLTAIVLGILAVIALASVLVAPVFQARLNEQFLLSARNQAFITEHIAGFETVKSLQMEPQLRKRYAGFLATYLQSGFQTQQIGNTYNVIANTLEQAMTLLVLMVGAYTVMKDDAFTIGMLVAFQMFSGKLSQPVLRIVGLWSQFQQAKLSVDRLGDLMNAPIEPYSTVPKRQVDGAGRIEAKGLAFRYADDRPMLFENLNLVVEPGRAMAIMGPSGTGKSTLAKLMLGFYQPTAGSLCVDGVDARHLSANELRNYFGVVPQETTLFSGPIFANLTAGNPGASFEQVVSACRMAGIHEVIEALPQGYHTEVGERGVGLSGGQKQRLAIARALLKGPKVLIFDEATSALDAETAESFARTINGLKGQVTMLFITHALPRNLKIDEVLHLSKDGAHQLRAVAAAAAPGGAHPSGPGAPASAAVSGRPALMPATPGAPSSGTQG
ncbi:peptidase domain-containing ABC transporter [Roseateles sp.]|uniref:peptidase domain-containing ABC transporter n=1 Tax=Roseateles sp. TaxID=1971397 RepID=UPI003D13BF8B